jgi:hypothetical protein
MLSWPDSDVISFARSGWEQNITNAPNSIVNVGLDDFFERYPRNDFSLQNLLSQEPR